MIHDFIQLMTEGFTEEDIFKIVVFFVVMGFVVEGIKGLIRSMRGCDCDQKSTRKVSKSQGSVTVRAPTGEDRPKGPPPPAHDH